MPKNPNGMYSKILARKSLREGRSAQLLSNTLTGPRPPVGALKSNGYSEP